MESYPQRLSPVSSLFHNLAVLALRPSDLDTRGPAADTLADLLEHILSAARSVARRVPPYLRAEFVEQAPGYVYTRLAQYRQCIPFGPWCWSVLRNLAVSEWRQRRRERARLEAWRRTRASHRIPLQHLDLDEPLSDADLAKIQNWDCRDRVLLLGMGGLWTHVPQPIREQWLSEAGVAPVSFARARLDELKDDKEKLALLAGLLGVSTAAAARRWYRKRYNMRQLDIVSQALGEQC